MKNTAFGFLFLILMLSSCVREPNYPAAPHIQFVSLTSNNVQSNALDTLVFSFTCGESGISVDANSLDIACGESDLCNLKNGDSSCLRIAAKNIFLIDLHGCITPYASPALLPTGKSKGIDGTINVFFNVTNYNCPLCGSAQCNNNLQPDNPYFADTLIYSVVLRDMAGNLSNFIQTPPIISSCRPQ